MLENFARFTNEFRSSAASEDTMRITVTDETCQVTVVVWIGQPMAENLMVAGTTSDRLATASALSVLLYSRPFAIIPLI